MTQMVEWGEEPPERINIRYKFRGGTSSRWAEVNPILLLGEPGYETDTQKMKLGDGVTRWLDLRYIQAQVDMTGDAALLAHINDPEPHPIYDDGPDLFLLYENAKV